MLRKTITALVLLLAALVSVQAQDRSLSAYAGLMAPYEFADVSDSPAPAGYKPFYISHYGRHGSRCHLGFTLENYIPAEMIEAHKAGALTDEGEAVLVKILYNEQETGIPALTPVQGPYYSWDEVRKHWTGND
ncbi:MAG: hypothetical protein K6E37_04240 [Bacteroidales bacterium]|nr:hypothetical protein [Bacteroidales bacterium]